MRKKIFVCTFLGILFSISFLDIMGKDKEFSNLESRYLKKKPKFSINKFLDGSYNKEVNEYINDQFIGRNIFINIKSFGEGVLGKIENNNIIYGKEEYMFYKTDELNNGQIEKNINAIKKFIEKSNINTKVMFIPYSSAIYKELLPKGTNLINEEKIINYSYKIIGEDNCINVLDTLKKHKEENIYYKTDHHWTTYGSYLGYLELCEKNKLNPIKLESLNKKTLKDFLGTYYRKAKKIATKEEEVIYYDMSNLSMNINGKEYSTVYGDISNNIEDKHKIFLNGNNPLTIVKNNDEKVKGKKILIFKDSFANSLVPFLGNNYEEVHIIDLRHFNGSIKSYINENSFRDVLILYSVNSINTDFNIVKINY